MITLAKCCRREWVKAFFTLGRYPKTSPISSPRRIPPQRAAVVDFLVRPVTVTVHFIKSSQNSREIQEFDRV